MHSSSTPRSRSFLSRTLALGAAICASVAAAACAPDKMPFSETESHTFAGGLVSTGHELNAGYQSYTRYCYACHGDKGDGKGPSSYGLRPPPRNFTQGIFKFARLRSSDDVPNDEDLVRIVKGGLHGTAMLPWDVQEDELLRIIQYIKTFAPQKWEKKKKSGEPVKALEPFEAGEDPWAGKDEQAISRGRELYHFKAECVNCHPGYGTKEELYTLSLEASKREPSAFSPLTGFRDDFYNSAAKDSEEYGVRILPPDFTFNKVRSIRKGTELEDLFRLLSFGVYPIMPAWKGALEDKDIWALSHYIKALLDTRDRPEAAAMRAKYSSQSPFEVPVAKPADPPPADPAPADGAKPDEKKDGATKDEKKPAVEKK